MLRIGITALITMTTTISVAAPVPKEILHPKIETIEGKTFNGDGVVAPTVYTFSKGGGLIYAYNGASHSRGSWKQTGNKIYWETNNKYCEFEGNIKNGVVRGKAWNVTGKTWELTFRWNETPK